MIHDGIVDAARRAATADPTALFQHKDLLARIGELPRTSQACDTGPNDEDVSLHEGIVSWQGP